MNRTENKNNFTRKYPGLGHYSIETAQGTPPIAEEAPVMNRAANFIKPVPFNGLLTNKLLAALPGEDFARLLQHLEPVALSCGDNLYGFDKDIEDVYFPENAVVSQLHILEDGSTTEAAIIGREGMLGLSAIFSSPAPTHLTQVTISGSALRIYAPILKQEFARGGAMQSILLAYASARLAQLSQKAVCNGRHTVEERLCTWLLMLQDRVGDNHLPLTHEQIASHLGTRRAGISESAASLRERQIISYVRGQIRILDRQSLERAACECYRALSRLNLIK